MSNIGYQAFMILSESVVYMLNAVNTAAASAITALVFLKSPFFQGRYKMFQSKPKKECNRKPICNNRHVHKIFSFIKLNSLKLNDLVLKNTDGCLKLLKR